jgi:hypothetical protein
MRVVIAGLLAGVALFFWGFVAHTLLPLGEMGMRAPVNEDVVLGALRDGLPAQGIYYLPYIDPVQMGDEAAIQAWVGKSLANPYALVIYHPQGRDGSQMGGMLGIQLASDAAVSVALAWVLGMIGAGFARRVAVAGLIGLIGWLATSLPYWNWYRFPLDFTAAALVEEVIGFLIAGAVAAWWLGRTARP